MSKPHKAFLRACDVLRGERKSQGFSQMADLIGVTRQAVSQWAIKGQPLPPEHVLKVEAATGISRHELRPDIYGEA